MDLLDRFLANLEVGGGAFTSCDIRLGYQLTFERCSTASLHYCLAGEGRLKIRNGSTIMLRQHSFVLLPPGVIYSIGTNENEEPFNFPRRRLRAPLFKESVPTIHAGDGEPGLLTACGEVGVAVTSAPDLFASLDKPIVEHFDRREGLHDQFVVLLAESSRPGLGTRAFSEALLKQCLILLLRRQIDRGTAPIPWMSAMAEPGLARALQAMLESPSERFTVEGLASAAGMSRSVFAARFTQTFGRTPLNLLKSERLRRARELLATTNAPVDQIARSVGSSSRSHFSHAFRTAYGVDPTNFRAAAFGKSKSALE